MAHTTHHISGTVVAITGAGRGIGKATARALIQRGAKVAIGDIDLATAEATARELGPSCTALRLDVTDRTSVDAFLDEAEATLGSIDVMINNAGIMPTVRFLEEDQASIDRQFAINVFGVMHGMRAVIPRMLQRGRGHVVNVASTAGKSPVPGGIVYCATKSAVVALTETARVEFAASGVSFTCVMPHFTNTDLIAGTTATKLIPMVEPDDVAAAIAGAILTQRKDVFVPKAIAPVLLTQPLLGRRIRDAIGRRLGAYDTFLTFDNEERASYDRRVSGS